MPIVIDASAIMPLVMDDEDDAQAASLVERIKAEGGIVPALFWYEIRSVLARAERTGRGTLEKREKFLALIDSLSLDYDFPAPSDALFSITGRHALTIYDAAYVELALRKQCSLATQDVALAKAARSEGLQVL